MLGGQMPLLLIVGLAGAAGLAGAWPTCRSDFDCSFNGRCDAESGGCRCAAAWTGAYCETLAVQPGPRALGYQGRNVGGRLSSWGGAPLRADDGQYHLIASEMIGHAGLLPWGCNSHVIHATSPDPLTQPFVKRRVLWGVFSHEPRCTRVRAPIPPSPSLPRTLTPC